MTPSDDAQRALLALDANGMASWRLDTQTDMVTGDDRLAGLYGFAPGHWPLPLSAITACIHPADAGRVTEAISNSAATGAGYEASFRVRRAPDADPGDAAAWRWLAGRGRPAPGADGGERGAILGVSWDVSAAGGGQAVGVDGGLLAAEMDHRVKNAFAIMRALINIGRRRATDLPSFADDLGAQVQAMADAHEVAARLARRDGDPRPRVPIAEVVETALARWTAAYPGQITTVLDRRLALPALRVSALSMLVQELATNAAKHGALRRAGGGGQEGEGSQGGAGTLAVTVEETRRDGAIAARLVWNEVGVMPLVQATPTRPTSGFGDVLIEHCMASLGAIEERVLRPEGLKLAVMLPLRQD